MTFKELYESGKLKKGMRFFYNGPVFDSSDDKETFIYLDVKTITSRNYTKFKGWNYLNKQDFSKYLCKIKRNYNQNYEKKYILEGSRMYNHSVLVVECEGLEL